MVHNKKHTLESRGKMSQSRMGVAPWNKGIKTGKNEEHSKKMKELYSSGKLIPWNKGEQGVMPPSWNKGKKTPDWLRKKQSEARLKGIKEGRIVAPFKGKKLNKEHREKISLNHRRYQTKETKIKIKENARTNPNFGFTGGRHTRKAKIIIKERRSRQIFPKKDTSIEVKMQNLLKQLGIEFVTHQYIKDIKYGYQCDIFIPVQERINQKTIIECDGDYWHGNLKIFNYNKLPQRIKNQRCLDYERNSQLEESGFRVIRLWEHKIKNLELEDLKMELRV